MAPFDPQNLPTDLLPPILAQLTDRRDWHACALVSKVFNRVASPLLYRTLDSRIVSKSLVHHPSTTLIKRPDLALHVRHVTETGAIHRGLLPYHRDITANTLQALSLCHNLRSMTWVDDSTTTDSILLAFLEVVRLLPMRELTIRTHSDLGETVWSQLVGLTGLRKISIWCMEGPPRVLQGWSGRLGSTLTHLELGRCAGVPPTILITVLSQLPLLKDLRLKGAPASAIPTILTFLPNLQSLDTEYHISSPHAASAPAPRPFFPASPDSSSTYPPIPRVPALKHLTLRTSSIDVMGPQKLWSWILSLVPLPGLCSFRLHCFTINEGHTIIPRMFILDLARIHSNTLRSFDVGEAQMTLNDVECLCSKFKEIEEIGCSVSTSDVASIKSAIVNGKNLRKLTLQVQWPTALYATGDRWSGGFSADRWSHKRYQKPKFALEDATDMMLRFEGSKLRVLAVGNVVYTGKWILESEDGEGEGEEVKEVEEGEKRRDRRKLKFKVTTNVCEEKWV
ncbi:hypothetical protein BDQ12DRAFT_621679 [Crucibulum laeve]|uniref:F-box domain-containing protein n=1 Tax=Crucibulum laeve TaxID=68775 RepID=A0A5C3MIQ2_9AGAR|nr:hypothetical protein BDQ12DRAFT_621679 [Crucibulum laeve]